MSASFSHQQRRHPPSAPDGPVNINYGHNGTYVVMQFTRVTKQIVLSPAQADAMIAALQKVKQMLAAHKQGQASD